MKIEFTLIDDDGKSYRGTAELIAVNSSAKPTNDHTSIHNDEPPKTLPTQIIKLRDEGFFRQPRSPSEVHIKLRETYHCLPDRVQMALLRLQRKRELRKSIKNGDREGQTAYVW